MSADDILLDVEERMEKAIGVLKQSLAGIQREGHCQGRPHTQG